MNDDRLEEELKKCFKTKYVMEERLKLQIERMAYEKRERADNRLLCVIQAAACVLSLIILIFAFIINRGMIIPVILMWYTMSGIIVSIGIALISHRKQHNYKEERII